MPANKNMKQQGTNLAERRRPLDSLRRPAAKAAGTRAGTLLDWREGSVKSGKALGGRFNALRDGR